MPVAAAIAGAAVIGGATSIIAGNKAAKAQKNAAETAAEASERSTQAQIEETRRQYDTTRADYAPYREVGYGALGKLAGLYGVGNDTVGSSAGDFQTTPGYAFRRDEGIKALERSASARGMLATGGTAKSIMRYADGLASSEYDNYANRLAALAGVGQSATGSTAAAGQNASNSIAAAYGANGQNQANSALATGNARASSYANTASGINSTVGNLASAYLFSQNGGFGVPKTGGTTVPPVDYWGSGVGGMS